MIRFRIPRPLACGGRRRLGMPSKAAGSPCRPFHAFISLHIMYHSLHIHIHTFAMPTLSYLRTAVRAPFRESSAVQADTCSRGALWRAAAACPWPSGMSSALEPPLPSPRDGDLSSCRLNPAEPLAPSGNHGVAHQRAVPHQHARQGGLVCRQGWVLLWGTAKRGSRQGLWQ
jgi:hypothetical protein